LCSQQWHGCNTGGEEDPSEAAEKFHHNVYVILLDPKVARHPTILRMNPKRDLAKPCVYVGMSGSLKSRPRTAVATTLPVLDVLPSKGD
jgi:hypothetical protein